MKKRITLAVVAMFAAGIWLAPHSAVAGLTARQIMQQVEDRDNGDNSTAVMRMILIDKNENKREKIFFSYTKEFGADEKRIMFVTEPAPVKDTGFLTIDYDDPDTDDDQWLYLPAVGKTKRIATADKDGSFMGSDLNYSDMTSRKLDDFTWKLLKETTIDGQGVWLVEALPKSEAVIDETGYKKAILAVRKDNFLVIRAKKWTSEGNYIKYVTAKKVEQIDGIWVITLNHIVKKRGNAIVHQTVLQLNDVRFNQGLDENLFTIRRLEKGQL